MKRIVWGVLATTMVATACDDAGESLPSAAANAALLKSHSVAPVLLKNLPAGVRAYSVISSDDVLEESPNFVFGGSADGSGMLRNADGTYTVLVNHEDNFSVSRVTLDESLKPIAGEYIVNSTQGRWRLCSAQRCFRDTRRSGRFL